MDFLKYTVEEAKKEAMKKGVPLQLYELISKMSSTKTSNYIFKNNGDLTFSDFSKEWGIFEPNLSFGAAYADLDNDGDLELITNNTNEVATIWKNNLSDKNENSYVRIKLIGPPGNDFATGAKIYIESDGVNQFQELFSTRGFQSSVEPIVHFGLGSSKVVSKLKIIWPDGKQTELADQKVNTLIQISYSSAVAAKEEQRIEVFPLFKNISATSNINFVHHENNFVDFDNEVLIPYQLSRSGPAFAKGDVNMDGADDFYIGGAAGQKSVLYLSDGNGQFIRAAQQPWEADAAKEDTGATFFDADGDGDLDLFVVSGGNEFKDGSEELDDRLYINNGIGVFVKAKSGSTPSDHVSGSCVTAGDFDKDGDLDLFVGGRARPGNFPLASPSAILRNESNSTTGEIKFVVATKEINPDLREVGMVTDALWNDFNNDGWLDLIVVGEWMPIRLFENEKGKLIEVKSKELEESSGLWNRVVAADLDSDGDLDFVVGNAGTNLPWHATMTEPITLYLNDFNKDGRMDPIICNYVQGKSYPVAARDELLLQMNNLRKKYITYSSYANSSLEDIVGLEQIKASKKFTVNTLQSSILENLGNGNFKLKALPIAAQVSIGTGNFN